MYLYIQLEKVVAMISQFSPSVSVLLPLLQNHLQFHRVVEASVIMKLKRRELDEHAAHNLFSNQTLAYSR